MMVARPLFRGARTVLACGIGGIHAPANPATVLTMGSMTAVAAVAEHMHCDHPGGEQHPNPILRKPFHEIHLCQ